VTDQQGQETAVRAKITAASAGSRIIPSRVISTRAGVS